MSNSIHAWVPLDSMVEDLAEEVHYRVAIPVYGKPASVFASVFDVSSILYPEPKSFQPSEVKEQLLEAARRPGFSRTFDEYLEWFMKHTTLMKDERHKLVKTGAGLYEVRRGHKAYAAPIPGISQLYGQMAEVGYPSSRGDFEGKRLRVPRAYAGWVDKVGSNYLRLNLGGGEYRRMTLDKVAWFTPISRDSLGQGGFHHQYLEVSFLRGRGGRLHVRVLLAGRGDFVTPLPPLEYLPEEVTQDGKPLGLSPGEYATAELLETLQQTLAAGVEKHELQNNRELTQLSDHIGRLTKGFTID